MEFKNKNLFASRISYSSSVFINMSVNKLSISRVSSPVVLNALGNREDIQRMFGTLEMEKPSIVPLASIASQLYSGVATICDAILDVRDRSAVEFRKIFNLGNISPTLCITYNSLVIFIQGCCIQIFKVRRTEGRLMAAGVPVELLVIATYAYAAFWVMQHILWFSLSRSTYTLIRNIGGNNIPLIRMHEIYFKVISGVWGSGTISLNGNQVNSNPQYEIKPTMNFERWHNNYRDTDVLVNEILNVIEMIDENLDKEEAYCIVKSLIDGKNTDYAGSGLTGPDLQRLQNYLGILNRANEAGSIMKLLVNGSINENNCRHISKVMNGFHTVLCAAGIPFKLVQDIQEEQLTSMEFNYAFPVISKNANNHPSNMELFIGEMVDINLSKFIAYGWASVIGSTVALNDEILYVDTTFGNSVLDNLLSIESEFNKPYGDLFRHSFIMLTGVISDESGTEINGKPNGLNNYTLVNNVKYLGLTSTGNFGQAVDKSIFANGTRSGNVVASTDLFNIDKYLNSAKKEKPVSNKAVVVEEQKQIVKETENQSKVTPEVSKNIPTSDTNVKAEQVTSSSNVKESVVKIDERKQGEPSVVESKSEDLGTEIGTLEQLANTKITDKSKGKPGDSKVTMDSINVKRANQVGTKNLSAFTGLSISNISLKKNRNLRNNKLISKVDRSLINNNIIPKDKVNIKKPEELNFDRKIGKNKENKLTNIQFKTNGFYDTS